MAIEDDETEMMQPLQEMIDDESIDDGLKRQLMQLATRSMQDNLAGPRGAKGGQKRNLNIVSNSYADGVKNNIDDIKHAFETDDNGRIKHPDRVRKYKEDRKTVKVPREVTDKLLQALPQEIKRNFGGKQGREGGDIFNEYISFGALDPFSGTYVPPEFFDLDHAAPESSSNDRTQSQEYLDFVPSADNLFVTTSGWNQTRGNKSVIQQAQDILSGAEDPEKLLSLRDQEGQGFQDWMYSKIVDRKKMIGGLPAAFQGLLLDEDGLFKEGMEPDTIQKAMDVVKENNGQLYNEMEKMFKQRFDPDGLMDTGQKRKGIDTKRRTLLRDGYSQLDKFKAERGLGPLHALLGSPFTYRGYGRGGYAGGSMIPHLLMEKMSQLPKSEMGAFRDKAKGFMNTQTTKVNQERKRMNEEHKGTAQEKADKYKEIEDRNHRELYGALTEGEDSVFSIDEMNQFADSHQDYKNEHSLVKSILGLQEAMEDMLNYNEEDDSPPDMEKFMQIIAQLLQMEKEPEGNTFSKFRNQ